jgi:hypothetical protein
VAKHQVQML